MSEVDMLQKKITLKATAPSTFYINVFASITHIGAGVSFFFFPPETKLNLVGVIPLHLWSAIFITHGVVKLSLLPFSNIANWKYIKNLMLVSIVFDIWWLAETLSAILINGLLGVLILVASLWFFLITTQTSGWFYFTPTISKTDKVKHVIE